MNMYADKKPENTRQTVANSSSIQQNKGKPAFQILVNRPEAIAQRTLQAAINNSPLVQQLKSYQTMADKFKQQHLQKKEANTGLAAHLKSGNEGRPAYSTDDLKVSHKYGKPMQMQAKTSGHANRLKTEEIGKQSTKPALINLHKPFTGNSPVQRIRIKLDHANDDIMNNVRATRVPRPGDVEVDGFQDYNSGHPPIMDNENIVLEGHGTYLNSNHKPNAPYDSQAELTPQQLANVAFLIPKSENWHGQIILFGCATGTLTLEVSRHYLALSGRSVNVVGTLADIRMEVPGDGHNEHRAEYNKEGKRYPEAPFESISARTKIMRWLYKARTGAIEAIEAMQLFNEVSEPEYANKARKKLKNELNKSIQCFNLALDTKLNFEGIIYNKGDNCDDQISRVRSMLEVAERTFSLFYSEFDNPEIQKTYLSNEAIIPSTFLSNLIKEINDLENMIMISKQAVPEGVVDWEGDNVVNSIANESEGLSNVPLSQNELISDKWGKRGGGQMLVQELLL